MTGEQTPSVGRIVHYVSHGTPVREDGTQAYTAKCRAAIVTEVSPESKGEGQEIVGLAVLNPTGFFFNQGCVHHEADPRLADSNPAVNHPGGTWHWPERVG
jgi:hypothetical protein